MNHSYNTLIAIQNDEFSDNYNLNHLNNLLNKKLRKYNDHNEEIQIQNTNKTQLSRSRDSRYSYKNRRIVNKDWKDFNNNQ